MIQGPWDQTTCTPGSSGPAFIYSKKRGRAHETGSLAKCRCPMAQDQSTAVAVHTSFRTAVQGSSSILARDRYSSGGWAGATQHTVKRNKEVHIEPSTGKDRPKRGRPSSTGCEGPSSLCDEVPGPRPLSCSRAGVGQASEGGLSQHQKAKDSSQVFGLSSCGMLGAMTEVTKTWEKTVGGRKQ